jgi:hypothetical protein
MAFGPNSPLVPSLGGYDSSSETDSPETPDSRSSPAVALDFATSRPNHSDFLFPPSRSGFSSTSSTATSTPVPSRSTSPLPQFFVENPSSSSDTDSEPESPLLRNHNRSASWGDDIQRRWWVIGTSRRKRRRRDGRNLRVLRKWTRLLIRHPLFPRQPITIVSTLLLLSLFAVLLTFLLIYILNPDKEPLPWRAYCSVPASSKPPIPSTISDPLLSPPDHGFQPAFPPDNLESLPPAGVFVGVFSMDSAFERRMLVRTTWASHGRSRDGAGTGDGGAGTSRSIVRFILGQPRKNWERRIKLEMELFNDIVILPVAENMNYGKTHAYFAWASDNAWVPPIYADAPAPQFSYSNITSPPPPLAPHDSPLTRVDRDSGVLKPWVRPDFTVKVDDDSFVMLAELEARLRHQLHIKTQDHLANPQSHGLILPNNPTTTSSESVPSGAPAGDGASSPLSRRQEMASSMGDPLIYWGYLVKNRFMGGELYALSWSLVNWVANDPVVKGMVRGAEDKQTAKWMRLHPRASEIRWASERCWIYDHPRSGTVYSHGFLFPSEARRVRSTITPYLDKTPQEVFSSPLAGMEGYLPPTPASWAYSSVTTFGVRYAPPVSNLTRVQNVEALVEGSAMSKLREGGPISPEYAWLNREGRQKKYEGRRVGGTVVVHFIKKNMWFLETAIALLEGSDHSEVEKFQRGDS